MMNNEFDKTTQIVHEWNELMMSEKESTEFMSTMFKSANEVAGTRSISEDGLGSLISDIILLKQIKKLEQQVTNLASIIADKL